MRLKNYPLLFFIVLFTSCGNHKYPSLDIVDPETKTASADSVFRANYTYKNLSSQFDVEASFSRYTIDDEQDSSVVIVYVFDKAGNRLDSMALSSRFYYADVFSSDTNVRSYTTHFNEGREVADDYFGDVVVADLNFDGRDDIAVISEVNNASVLYKYYVQTGEQRFIMDNFLSDSVASFPMEINSKKREIITYNRAGCCHVGKHTYRLNNGMWKQIKHELLGAEKDGGI